MKPVVVILSVSSDIGFYLAKRYAQDGYRVMGTYRFLSRLAEIELLSSCHLFHCDISDKKSVENFLSDFEKLKINWDIFISCVGDLRPYGNFFEADFDAWSDSVRVNSIEQLRIVHALYPLRNKKTTPSVVFFAGGGTNNAPADLSAYIASKIMLTKMCELLDAENTDLKVFIVGPGYIKTKIHKSIKANIAQGKKETALGDVYQDIRSLIAQDKKVVSGRNFSVAHDPLFGVDACMLARELVENPNIYKLRRYGNDIGGKI